MTGTLLQLHVHAWKLTLKTQAIHAGYRAVSVHLIASKLIEHHVKAFVEQFLEMNAPVAARL